MRKLSKILEEAEKSSREEALDLQGAADVIWFEDAVSEYASESAWTRTREIPLHIKDLNQFFDKAYSMGVWIQFSRQGGTVSLIGTKDLIRTALQKLIGMTQDEYVAQVRSESPYIPKAQLNQMARV
jgi:hypothetical protein